MTYNLDGLRAAVEIEAKFKACQTVEALADCKAMTLEDRKRIVAEDRAYADVFKAVMLREHDRVTGASVSA